MANRIYSETLHALEHTEDPPVCRKRLHGFVLDRIPQEGFYFTMAAARFTEDGRRMTFAAVANYQPFSSPTAPSACSSRALASSVASSRPRNPRRPKRSNLRPAIEWFSTPMGIEVFNRSGDMLGVEGLEKIVRQSAMRALPEMKQAILGWPRRLETRHYDR
jgi:hypothetical protein